MSRRSKANTAQFCEVEKSTVVGVGQDRQQIIMSDNKNTSLYCDGGGREGGAYVNRIPKSVKCEEDSCQFTVELEDETSAKRVLANHKFVTQDRDQAQAEQYTQGPQWRRRQKNNSQTSQLM